MAAHLSELQVMRDTLATDPQHEPVHHVEEVQHHHHQQHVQFVRPSQPMEGLTSRLSGLIFWSLVHCSITCPLSHTLLSLEREGLLLE